MSSLVATAAYANQLRFDTSAGLGGVGARLGPIIVRRVADSGAPLDVGALTATTVTLFADSAFGEFTPSKEPTAAWSKVLAVPIASGERTSPPIYFRDRATGTPRVVVQVPGYTDIVQTFLIDAQTFSADFETGTFLESESPPGPFVTRTQSPDAVGQPLTSRQAAHRGSFGIRCSDLEATRTGAESGAEWFSAPLSPNIYVRAWVRVSADSQSRGAIVPLSIGTGFPGPTIQDLLLVFPLAGGNGPLKAYGQGHEASGALSQDLGAKEIQRGQWHLAELVVTGLDTNGATREVWIDGALSARRFLVDLRGRPFSVVRVGELWAKDAPYVGSFDLDDVRVSTVPQASKLQFELGPERVVRGECLKIAVTLRDSRFGAGAASPYAFDATLSMSGPGVAQAEFFEDIACTEPATALELPFDWGASQSAPRSVRFITPGEVRLAIQFVDFLGDEARLEVVGPPVAHITPTSARVAPGQRVTLDAGASSAAPPATIESYEWAIIKGPTGVGLTDGAVQEFALEVPGNYRFTLMVTDSNGQRSAPVSAEVIVEGDTMHPPPTLGCVSVPTEQAALALLGLLLVVGLRRASVSSHTARA